MTTAADVVELLEVMDSVEASPVVVGGWGVDALVGRATRTHRDLDVLVRADQVDRVVGQLEALGMCRGVDWLPVRVEFSDERRTVDVHPAHDDGAGGWWQHGLGDDRFEYPASALTWGTIEGRPVRCLTAARQIELHSGYDPRPEDLHDLGLLREIAR